MVYGMPLNERRTPEPQWLECCNVMFHITRTHVNGPNVTQDGYSRTQITGYCVGCSPSNLTKLRLIEVEYHERAIYTKLPRYLLSR
jgi:hypothetical protein